MRPFFPFYGSKWNAARRYPQPIYGCVIEPFAGSAGYSVFYNVSYAVLVDADPIIARVWHYLMHVDPKEILKLPELPEVGDSVDNYKLPQEAKWLIGFWLNRGSATPKKSRTAYSARTDKAQLNWGRRAKERIADQLQYIRRWTIIEGSYYLSPDILAAWFIDPPYVQAGKYYRTRFSDYTALARWCPQRKGQVIVCEGPKADWLPFRDLATLKSTKGKSKERVWLGNEHRKGAGA